MLIYRSFTLLIKQGLNIPVLLDIFSKIPNFLKIIILEIVLIIIKKTSTKSASTNIFYVINICIRDNYFRLSCLKATNTNDTYTRGTYTRNPYIENVSAYNNNSSTKNTCIEITYGQNIYIGNIFVKEDDASCNTI